MIFEEEHLDTDETDSELMIAALESFAQSKNESRSENIRLGLSKRAAIGTSGLYTRRLYGCCKDSDGSLKIDEEQAKLLETFSDGIWMAQVCWALLKSCLMQVYPLQQVRKNGVSMA